MQAIAPDNGGPQRGGGRSVRGEASAVVPPSPKANVAFP